MLPPHLNSGCITDAAGLPEFSPAKMA